MGDSDDENWYTDFKPLLICQKRQKIWRNMTKNIGYKIKSNGNSGHEEYNWY